MKILNRFALVLSLGALGSVAYAQCPAAGVATDCTTQIVVGPGGGLTVSAGTGGTTYDGSDDQLVGFTNNSSVAVSSITLNGGPGNNIFGFESDGIDTFLPVSNASDTSGYGGSDAFFSNISPDGTTGTVNFITPIAANGGFTFFSLEDPFTTGITGTTGGGVTPEPSTLLLFGTGALGLAVRLRSRFARPVK